MPGLPAKQAGAGARELNTKFKVVKLVGKGSYGSVYQVQRLSDGKTYALKEMDVRSMNQAERADSANEVRLLASIAHPNVIAYHEAFLDGHRLCIIMEYAPDGDLSKVIKRYTMSKSRMPEDKLWLYFIQVARGLAQLHDLKILHRDIKPGNIMVMANGVCKIGDLGIAKILRHTMAKTQIGTPHYMPPEIWRNKQYGFRSDSWAMGCILYEMATNSVPFEARSMNELKSKVLRGHYPAIPSCYSQELIQLVAQCLHQDPDRRPSMHDILNSGAVTSRMHLLDHLDMPRILSRAPSNNGLLDTIHVPRNYQLIKGKLPPASYATDQSHMADMGEEVASQARSKLPMLTQAQQQAARAEPPAAQARPPVPRPLQPVAQKPPPRIYPPSNVMAPTPQQGAYHPSSKQPPASVYEALRSAMAGNKHNMYTPKGSAVSESHAAYGAFYYSPKGQPPMYKNPGDPWGAPTPKRPPAAQQQAHQQAHHGGFQGYYNPYANGGAGQQPYAPPAKLPSIQQRGQQGSKPPANAWNIQQQGQQGSKPPANAWNFGAGGNYPNRNLPVATPASQWGGGAPRW